MRLLKGNRDIVEEAFPPNFAFHSHTHIDPPLRGLEGSTDDFSVGLGRDAGDH
jgi:hypothetical protein